MSGRQQIHDWFLREWMVAKDKRQADIIREVGWERGRVSKIVNGVQPYTREDVAALSAWLGVQPYELLMPPAEAHALRALKESAIQIAAAAEAGVTFEHSSSGGKAR